MAVPSLPSVRTFVEGAVGRGGEFLLIWGDGGLLGRRRAPHHHPLASIRRLHPVPPRRDAKESASLTPPGFFPQSLPPALPFVMISPGALVGTLRARCC